MVKRRWYNVPQCVPAAKGLGWGLFPLHTHPCRWVQSFQFAMRAQNGSTSYEFASCDWLSAAAQCIPEFYGRLYCWDGLVSNTCPAKKCVCMFNRFFRLHILSVCGEIQMCPPPSFVFVRLTFVGVSFNSQ